MEALTQSLIRTFGLTLLAAVSTALAAGLVVRLFDATTRGLEELKELGNANIAVGVLLGLVVMAVGIVVGLALHGVNA